MQADGVLIVHGDDKALIAACGGPGGRKVTFGLEKTNNLWASNIRTEARGVLGTLNGTRQEVFIPLLGRHVAVNLLAAIAVARRHESD